MRCCSRCYRRIWQSSTGFLWILFQIEHHRPVPKNVGERFSYSLSLWERARVRARSVAKKKKDRSGMVSVLAKPSPQPSPGRGRLEDSDAMLATDHFFAH